MAGYSFRVVINIHELARFLHEFDGETGKAILTGREPGMSQHSSREIPERGLQRALE